MVGKMDDVVVIVCVCVCVRVCADVRCVDDNDDDVQPDERCNAATSVDSLLVAVRPSIVMACSVPCHVSSPCFFSHWTPWSPCSRRCDGLSTRSRFMEGRPLRAVLLLTFSEAPQGGFGGNSIQPGRHFARAAFRTQRSKNSRGSTYWLQVF